VRLSITLRLSLNFLGIGLLKENCQFRAKLREMIKKLCIREII